MCAAATTGIAPLPLLQMNPPCIPGRLYEELYCGRGEMFYNDYIMFMGIAALKFKSGDMEAMGKNLGGSVMLFLVPKIVETIITWAAK